MYKVSTIFKYHGMKLTYRAQIILLKKPTQHNREFGQSKNLFTSDESWTWVSCFPRYYIIKDSLAENQQYTAPLWMGEEHGSDIAYWQQSINC